MWAADVERARPSSEEALQLAIAMVPGHAVRVQFRACSSSSGAMLRFMLFFLGALGVPGTDALDRFREAAAKQW